LESYVCVALGVGSVKAGFGWHVVPYQNIEISRVDILLSNVPDVPSIFVINAFILLVVVAADTSPLCIFLSKHKVVAVVIESNSSTLFWSLDVSKVDTIISVSTLLVLSNNGCLDIVTI
jgi:hypothetical protein